LGSVFRKPISEIFIGFHTPLGGGTVNSGFGPLLVVVGPLLTVLDHFASAGGHGPETTELTSLSSNQAFTFTSLTWIFSRKTVKLC